MGRTIAPAMGRAAPGISPTAWCKTTAAPQTIPGESLKHPNYYYFSRALLTPALQLVDRSGVRPGGRFHLKSEPLAPLPEPPEEHQPGHMRPHVQRAVHEAQRR